VPRAATARKTKPEPTGEEDLALLVELAAEQRSNALSSAKKDARGVSAFWIAKGDHLVLMVVSVSGKKAVRKTYKCRLLDFVEEDAEC
jgi:hypothetical protein